jgi:predicted ATPase
MIYLEKIKVVKKTFPGSQVLRKKFEITCGDVNLFVGNQGCGKSTMLNLLQENHSDIEIVLSQKAVSIGVKSYYFDSEKDNPRIRDINSFSNPDGTGRGGGIGFGIASRFKSHGETLEEMVIEPLLKAKNCVVLLDEPESGLSITNQFRLIEAMNTAVSNGCQLFIATHCYPLIECFDVISLEHRKQMKGVDFINKVKSK